MSSLLPHVVHGDKFDVMREIHALTSPLTCGEYLVLEVGHRYVVQQSLRFTV
jgi:hypothetical protein